MKIPFRKKMFEKLESLDKISDMKKNEIVNLLNEILKDMLSILSKYLNNKPIVQKRIFDFSKIELKK